MTPDGIRERFDLYRKWFQTFLVREFMNLPSRYQNRFLAIAEKFLKDCRRIYEEGKAIQEKEVRVIIKNVLPPDNQGETYVIQGITQGVNGLVSIHYPVSKPKPQIDSTVVHIMFSSDGETWYSSKTELITGRPL